LGIRIGDAINVGVFGKTILIESDEIIFTDFSTIGFLSF
jgi:hypothetical protein